jgi:Aldo/keto reductase family
MKMTSDPNHLRETVDEARKILGVDCIDLIVQARQDPKSPIEDVMLCFKELVEAGARPRGFPSPILSCPHHQDCASCGSIALLRAGACMALCRLRSHQFAFQPIL